MVPGRALATCWTYHPAWANKHTLESSKHHTPYTVTLPSTHWRQANTAHPTLSPCPPHTGDKQTPHTLHCHPALRTLESSNHTHPTLSPCPPHTGDKQTPHTLHCHPALRTLETSKHRTPYTVTLPSTHWRQANTAHPTLSPCPPHTGDKQTPHTLHCHPALHTLETSKHRTPYTVTLPSTHWRQANTTHPTLSPCPPHTGDKQTPHTLHCHPALHTLETSKHRTPYTVTLPSTHWRQANATHLHCHPALHTLETSKRHTPYTVTLPSAHRRQANTTHPTLSPCPPHTGDKQTPHTLHCHPALHTLETSKHHTPYTVTLPSTH